MNALEGTGLEAGLAEVNSLMVHPFVERTAVVEYTVQDDMHIPAVNLLAKGGEQGVALLQIFHAGYPADILRGIAVMLFPGLHFMIHIIGDNAEMRIDMLIVLAVIFMAGRGDKDRIQVQGFNAQILEVIQLVQDTLQVTAVEGTDIGVSGHSVPVGNMLGVTDDVIILIIRYIVGRIPVEEPVRENLVLHGAFRPAGHMEPRNKPEGIGGIVLRDMMLIRADTAFIIGDLCAVRALDQEAINHFGFAADDAGFIIIEKVIAFRFVHHGPNGHGLKKQNNAFGTVFRNPQTDPDGIADIRL